MRRTYFQDPGVCMRVKLGTYVVIAVTPILREEGVKRGIGVEEKGRKAVRWMGIDRFSSEESPEMVLGVERRDEGLNWSGYKYFDWRGRMRGAGFL